MRSINRRGSFRTGATFFLMFAGSLDATMPVNSEGISRSTSAAGSDGRSARGQASSCATLPSDMVAWLPGDGDTFNLRDVVNGEFSGGTLFGAGKVGQGFETQ